MCRTVLYGHGHVTPGVCFLQKIVAQAPRTPCDTMVRTVLRGRRHNRGRQALSTYGTVRTVATMRAVD